MRAARVKVSTNVRGVQGKLRRLHKNQLPFSASKALNLTTKDFQRDQVAHMGKIFTVRRPAWIRRGVKIKPWATKRRLYAQVQIEPPGGQRRADIITKFERQTYKKALRGNLAIPSKELRKKTKTGVIPKALRPRALDMKAHGASNRVMKGKKRTFLIHMGHEGFIFQRLGRRLKRKPGSGRRGNVRLLYYLKPRVAISPELNFMQNARNAVKWYFPGHMRREFRRAIRTAR
jgi:hypothetical protein